MIFLTDKAHDSDNVLRIFTFYNTYFTQLNIFPVALAKKTLELFQPPSHTPTQHISKS